MSKPKHPPAERTVPGVNPRLEWRVGLAVVVVTTLAMVFLYGRIDYEAEPFVHWDLDSYRSMAAAAPGFFQEGGKPSAYRILGPYLVGILPFEDTTGFYLFTVVAAMALTPLFYVFLQDLGIRPATAAFATVLYTFNRYLFGFMVWDYFQLTDSFSLVFIVLMYLALHRRRWAVFGTALALSAMTKELGMLMVPVGLVYLHGVHTLKTQAGRLALASLPAVAVFGLIRALVPAEGGRDLLQAFLVHSPRFLEGETWLRLLGNSFVPLSLIPVVYWDHALSFVRRRKDLAVLWLLVLASTTFAGNNERLMAAAFVPFFGFVASLIQDRLRASPPVLAILAVACLAASFHHLYGIRPLANRDVTIALSWASLIVVTLTAMIYRMRTAPAASGGGTHHPPGIAPD